MLKKTSSIKSNRNPFTIRAKKRKGGPMKNKKDKRKTNKKQKEIFEENY